MISEVDEALRSVLKAEVTEATDVEVVFDAPTRDWAARRNKPTINMYLYDIREDLRRRQVGMVETRDDKGIVTERKQLPRFFKLAYLITAWTQRAEDEHRLLSGVLATFMKYDSIPEGHMTATLTDSGFPVLLQIAYPLPENQQVPDVWSSLGGDLKPSLDLIATMIVQPDSFFDVAKAVMKPLRLNSKAQNTFEADDGVRYLRDAPAGEDQNGSSSADGGGEKASKAAPKPKA